MELVIIFTGLFLIGLGFLVKANPNLIAGYNTLSEEEKKKVDVDKLSSLLRNGLVMIGVVVIVGSYLLGIFGFGNATEMFMLMTISVGTVVLIAMAQKFDHNK